MEVTVNAMQEALNNREGLKLLMCEINVFRFEMKNGQM